MKNRLLVMLAWMIALPIGIAILAAYGIWVVYYEAGKLLRRVIPFIVSIVMNTLLWALFFVYLVVELMLEIVRTFAGKVKRYVAQRNSQHFSNGIRSKWRNPNRLFDHDPSIRE